MVESGGLENRCAGNRTEGSNPSPSADHPRGCEKRPDRGGGEAAPLAGRGDLVAELDDAVCRWSLEAAPADELGWVPRDEETGVPGRSVRIRGDGVARGAECFREGRPAGYDVVAEHLRQDLVAGKGGVHQVQLGSDEADHAASLSRGPSAGRRIETCGCKR